jgi:hypothetical protein
LARRLSTSLAGPTRRASTRCGSWTTSSRSACPAGAGEQKTLRFVARYADACHLPDLPGTRYEVDLGHKLDVLRRHCDDAGRDYGRIEKTVGVNHDLGDGTAGDLAWLLARLSELSALGFGHAMLSPRDRWTEALVDAVASVLPEIRALGG